MSTFSIYRPVGSDDEAILDERAVAFVRRHNLTVEVNHERQRLYEMVSEYVDQQEAMGEPRLARLWAGVIARVAGGWWGRSIAYNCFGHTVR
jgi:hypothetical protein